MTSTTREFLHLIEKNFHFEYSIGDSTLVRYPHTTNWRVLPFLVISQLNYAATVDLKDGRKLDIEPGQTLSMPPGLVHNITKKKRGAGYSHWSHIQCEIFSGLSLFHLIEPPFITKGSASLKIGQINAELGEIAAQELSLHSLLRRQSLGWELISTLLLRASFDEDRIDLIRHASRLTPVLTYIEQNLGEAITHEQLARVAGLSPSRFHTVFRSALGSAPYDYVQKLRLKKAQELLIRSDKTVAEIGQETGFPDPYHFSRLFRKNVGLSPTRYRKQLAPHEF